jgi:NADPH:quinone reductase-like Zn-dependent oxidoreductase
MRAVVIHQFGGRDQLQLAEVPAPVPGKREVLIRIVAAGVNPVDWKIREGLLRSRLPHQFPIILGLEAAGVVVSTGSAARRFKPGDEVYAYARKPIIKDGAYAEYIVSCRNPRWP